MGTNGRNRMVSLRTQDSVGLIKRISIFFVIPLCWVAIAGAGMWNAAKHTHEPPSMDTLSYFQKANGFWESIDKGELVNPLNIQPTVRPPGTIVMSYPFGFTFDFHGFYFRSVYFPILLFVAAVYIAGYTSSLTEKAKWAVLGLAIALGGTPMLFQFQSNDALQAASFWGLTDGFLSGTAALAIAAAIRSVRVQSTKWALSSALAGAFCLMIKPSGALVMAVVGIAWFAIAMRQLNWRFDVRKISLENRKFFLKSLGLGSIIYFLATVTAFGSAYFSAANVAYGQNALAVTKNEFTFLSNVSLYTFATLLKICVGYAIPCVIATGLILTILRRNLCISLLVVMSLLVGFWFWAIECGLEVVRYFLPFPAMAFILVVPSFVAWVNERRVPILGPILAVFVAPSIVTTVLLFVPAASKDLQGALGINLVADAYAAENQQSAHLLEKASRDGIGQAGVYFYDTTPALRNLYAVIEYSWIANPGGPRFSLLQPRDWQRPTAFRLDDMKRARYLAFELVPDPEARRRILTRRQVKDFTDETLLLDAWSSGLTENQGVSVISDTRVRLVEVKDWEKFESAFAKLVAAHDWPQSFLDGDQQRLLSQRDVPGLPDEKLAAISDVHFHGVAEDSIEFIVRSVSMVSRGSGLEVTVSVEQTRQEKAAKPWVLFGHLVDQKGQIVANAQADIASPSTSVKQIVQRYTLTYPNRPLSAVAIALGFFYQSKGGGLEHILADSGQRDWDDRRVLYPLK
jgi:hypothetical protein